MCMAVPWLGFLGFSVIFSALFAKLWRVNRLFRSGGGFQRVKIGMSDVLIPLALLLTANVITLLAWTLIDPLRYTRVNAEGTDPWNRVIATYGMCTMEQPWPYVSILAALNLGVLIFATVQAYQARNISSEFAESKHIAMAVVSMLQVSLIGIPLMAVARDDPQAWYLALVFLIFVVCMAVLVLIFLPKTIYTKRQSLRTEVSQQRIISASIRQTQQRMMAQISATHPSPRSRTGSSDKHDSSPFLTATPSPAMVVSGGQPPTATLISSSRTRRVDRKGIEPE